MRKMRWKLLSVVMTAMMMVMMVPVTARAATTHTVGIY